MGDPILDAGYLRLEIEPPVAVLTLDRPEALNAQTPATWVALNHAADLLPPEVRVVVLTGAGRAFSAGLDRAAWTDGSLRSVADLPDSLALDQIERYQRAFVRLTEPDRITIAAVRGPAVGAGFQLALACHLIVAADDAVFSLYEVALGLVPDLGGIGRLARSVGERRTLELAATGRQLGAAEAAYWGLVTRVVPGDQLDAAVRELVAALVANPEPAVRAVTELVDGAASREPREQLMAERSAQLPLLRALNRR